MDRINERSLGQFTVQAKEETGEGVHLAQSVFLDELPGLMFALITLVWILSSFASLIWREIPSGTLAHLQSFARAFFLSPELAIVSRLAGAAGFARIASGLFNPRRPV